MSEPIRLAIVGLGAIARDHHIPSIAANPAFTLQAVVSRHARMEQVATFSSIEEVLAVGPPLDAIAVCTPPQTHYDIALSALQAGKHVLLEKPPCTSLAQLAHLEAVASESNVAFYQTWHSQHGAGVAAAATLLQARRPTAVRAVWKEDVRRWHPGQTWIWEPGGFGIFDPGINAISILTKLIDEPLFPVSATLSVPSNCQSPIAARVNLRTPSGLPLDLNFDFRHTGEQTWDIEIDTDGPPLRLGAGGGLLSVGGRAMPAGTLGLRPEYESIYRRFAALTQSRKVDTDARPLTVVADIFMTARREIVDSFIE